PKQTATEIRARLEAALAGIDAAAQVAQLDVVGPQVGSELRVSAMWALFFTLVLIFLYIAFRFHTWRLSLGAILAVLHDPIVVVGLLFLGGPVLKGFSAALLIGIIAGTYSSIYISSAIALDFGLTAEHVFPTVKKAAFDHLP